MSIAAAAPPSDADFAARRALYTEELAAGVARFVGPRRATCPWCGSGRLRIRTRLPDLVQRKPGRFAFDECRVCGHVFQNPAPTAEGLAFYYRDFYDGLGASTAETFFGWQTQTYLDRARAADRLPAPRSWLDVGAGHGHFAATARGVWPQTRFTGLDQGAGVLSGLRRGWLDAVHQGELAALETELTHRHDMVSMFHYLEHLPDPRAELDVVARILAPGAHLMLELPDPEFLLGRALGPLWTPCHTLQHLHLMPLRNLLAALTGRGLIPVRVQRREAHMAVDLTCAVLAVGQWIGPDPRLPWLGEARLFDRFRHRQVHRALPKAVGWSHAVDQRLARLVRAAGTGNVYRVLARRCAEDPR